MLFRRAFRIWQNLRPVGAPIGLDLAAGETTDCGLIDWLRHAGSLAVPGKALCAHTDLGVE